MIEQAMLEKLWYVVHHEVEGVEGVADLKLWQVIQMHISLSMGLVMMTRRMSQSLGGPVIPPPIPTLENRIWIWVETDEFNIQNQVYRTIGSILKLMWSGGWQGWKDVPILHRGRMFERFQQVQLLEDKIAKLESKKKESERGKLEKNAMLEKIEENARLYVEMNAKL